MRIKNINKPLLFYRFYNLSLYGLLGQSWFRAIFYSRMLAAIQTFYRTHQPAMEEDEFIRQVLFNNSGDLRKWILFSRSTEQIMAHIRVDGEKHLVSEANRGNGLILVNFHTGLSQATHLVLKIMGIGNNNYSISKMKYDHDPENLKPSQGGEVSYTTQSLQAVDALFNGGVVFISSDGNKGGNRGVTIPFLGRWHEYKTGFAELALASGAAVIPVSASLLPDGTVNIRFLPPLDTGDDQMEKAARIEGMVYQLSNFIAQQWITLPTTIKYKRLIEYNNQPGVQDPVQVRANDPIPGQRTSKGRSLAYMLLMYIRRFKKKIIHKKTH